MAYKCPVSSAHVSAASPSTLNGRLMANSLGPVALSPTPFGAFVHQTRLHSSLAPKTEAVCREAGLLTLCHTSLDPHVGASLNFLTT